MFKDFIENWNEFKELRILGKILTVSSIGLIIFGFVYLCIALESKPEETGGMTVTVSILSILSLLITFFTSLFMVRKQHKTKRAKVINSSIMGVLLVVLVTCIILFVNGVIRETTLSILSNYSTIVSVAITVISLVYEKHWSSSKRIDQPQG